MNLLGLHINTGQTAAAILSKGEIIAGAAEERFNRIKLSRAFPRNAIDFCLRQAGVECIEKLDGLAISWNPSDNMRHINLSGFTDWRRYDPEWLYIVPNNIFSITGENAFVGDVLKMELSIGSGCPFYFVRHHMAHLAHAICQSPFERGLAVVIDEYGEFNSVTVAKFTGDNLEIIREIPYPHSLGVFYATLTEYLGFTPNSDEWKVMGAAAYGNPVVFRDKVESIFAWDNDEGEWILDTRFVEHANMKRSGYMSERLEKLIGIPCRLPSQELNQAYFDLAAASQDIFEERLFQLLSFYGEKTGEKNLAAAGGCFMNCLASGKIRERTPFKNLFIPYAAADNGGAMGSALYVWHYLMHNERTSVIGASNPYLGPAFDDEEIEVILKKYRIPYRRVNNPAQYAAEEIAKGRLIGWFQGSMEFGERALGNRSILADPRDERMKVRINAAVKYREFFRPFAPSIIAERAGDYFIIPKGVSVPYMEQVYPIKQEKRALVPAIVHADGTGRLQTVTKESNPLFYDLLQEFERITGIPLVLNTSFNVQGEPIVCKPTDAIRTFYSCGLDILVVGRCIVNKKND